MKKFFSIVLAVVMLLTVSVVPVFNASAASISSSDYPVALKDAIWFYDANKCGKDVAADNVFSWRSACHTKDGNDLGVDLTGGFHDCGDHIKFGITNGYAASILGWSLYEFKDAFDASGNTNKILSTLKYFTDYIMKCRVSSTKYYYHVGGSGDHAYWGPPEKQTDPRDHVYYMGSGSGAADVCGLYSGALSLMYLNYKSIDSSYADKCLTYSKELYELGKANPGTGKADGFYTSSASNDDMAWAAMWLYAIEKNNTYLSSAESFLPSPGTNWTICWNDMKLAVAAAGAELTGQSKYKDAISSNLSYWKSSVTTSGGGLKILDSWGTLRYTASEAFLALLYYKLYKDESAKTFAKTQMDYILGANPKSMSYIIGFGTNYPKHPHHRAASGYEGWDNWKQPAKNVLTGALVGGPNASDVYNDVTDDYKCTEVGIDYNAGLVGALAGMVKFSGNLPQNTPTPVVSATPTYTETVEASGYVKADAGSNSGFKVELNGIMTDTQLTDSNGYFKSTKCIFNGNNYTLRVSKDGFLTRTFTDINNNSAVRVQLGSSSAPVIMWAGDVNQDGAINMGDIVMIAGSFNSSSGDARYAALYDLNKDNAVNMSDIMIPAGHFNKTANDYPAVSITRS